MAASASCRRATTRVATKPRDDAHRHARHGEPREAAERRPGVEGAGEGGGHREAVEHEAGGVVHEAFAFEDGDGLARQRHPREHRLGRDGIRRRDDGAEREAGGPGQAGGDRMGDHPDDQRREQHGPEGQGEDRPDRGAEIPPDGEIGRFEQERRQEQDQDQVRVEVEGRQARRDGERHAADHEGHGGRQAEPAGDQGQDQRGREQREHQFEQGDGCHAPAVDAAALRGKPEAVFRARLRGSRRGRRARAGAARRCGRSAASPPCAGGR